MAQGHPTILPHSYSIYGFFSFTTKNITVSQESRSVFLFSLKTLKVPINQSEPGNFANHFFFIDNYVSLLT